MSIDVIIPVRNGEIYISECLESVLNQSAIAHVSRIIVIDDGSADGTAKVVETYLKRNRIVELHSTEPRGLSAARNYGLRISTAKNVAFLDSDDLWLPQKLEAHLDHLGKHSNCFFSFTLASEFQKNSNLAKLQGFNSEEPTFNSILLQEFRIYGSGSSVFVDRSLACSKGGFDEEMRFGEDWDFWLKLSQRQLPCQLSESATLIRIHSLSMQRKKRTGDERFLNSLVHFQEWAKYPQIFQDSRFRDVAIRVMWADFRKNFRVREFLNSDYCDFLFTNNASILQKLGLKRNRFFTLMLIFHRLKTELWSLRR